LCLEVSSNRLIGLLKMVHLRCRSSKMLSMNRLYIWDEENMGGFEESESGFVIRRFILFLRIWPID
jgi:hypothetical protein